MIFGGFSTSPDSCPRPVGAEPVAADWRVWKLGDGPTRLRRSATRPPSPSEPAISSPDPILWIGTDTCALGPYRADLVETYWRWEQDPTLLVGYGRQSPESLEARTEGMAHQLRGENIRFTIYDRSTGEPVPVGVTTLLPDHSVRTAEYVVMLAPEARGRGLGTQATRLTLDYAFHVTNLRMVWLKVLAPNKAGIRAYEKAGFRTVGALREAGYWLSQVCDEVIMDALATGFSGPSVITPLLPS